MIPKHKGNLLELKIYKDLRDMCIKSNKSSNTCKRTIGSGSSDEPGDIHLCYNNQTYIIECKNYICLIIIA